jgi:penicillin-binding protein 1A
MKRSVKYLWRFFFLCILLVVGLFAAINFGLFGKMPSLRQLENPEADLATEIISADGLLMGKYYAENRSEVTFQEISPNVIHALIATEDERFDEHSGIDAEALGRVVTTMGKSGGSTLSQQLAKMIMKQGQGNMFERGIDKLKEWIIALKLERNFTKDEIVSLYLNRAPWGNIFGIRNASLTYFQKEPKDLKIEEAAVLVGMLKGPSIYEPINHAPASLSRRNVVIGQMVAAKQHYLTEAQAAVLKAKPLITNYKTIDENIGIAPHFRHALIDVMKKWCKENKNPKTGENYDLFKDGLRIYTTIDSRMQTYAEEAVNAHMPNVQSKLNYTLKYRGEKLWAKHESTIENAIKQTERWKSMKANEIDEATIRKSFTIPTKMRVFSWKGGAKHEKDTTMTPLDSIKYHKKIMQTSFLAMDPITGEIKAWVGSADYKWFKYDHVTTTRQVGSTFKPLLYTLAVQDIGYTPETAIPGGSLTLSGKTITGGGGTMANCLAQSKNFAAWTLMSKVGVKRTIEFATQCGVKAKLPPYPSIALGTGEVPMIEMLQAYTMFPNKGYNTEPVFATRIEDKNGNLIYEFPLAQSKQVIGEQDAYTMVTMMRGVVAVGTAKRLNSYNIPAQKAGKTGTTNDNTDGWFIGYTPTLLAGTWVGCEDPFIPIYQNNAGGAEMAAPAWGNFMAKVYGDKKLKKYSEKKEFTIPVELKGDPIEADARFFQAAQTGDRPDRGEFGDPGAASSSTSNQGDDFFTEEVSPEVPAEDGGAMVEPDTSKNVTPPTKDAPKEPSKDKKPTVAAPTEDKNKAKKPKTPTKPKETPDDGGF